MDKQRIQQAQHLYQQGDFEQALAIYRELLQSDPHDPALLHACAVLLAQTGDHQAALKQINAALKNASNNETLFNSKGNILLALNRFDEAIQAYQAAIALKPHYAPAYNNLGNCYYHQQNLSDAKSAYQKAITLQPHYPDAYYHLGITLAHLGELPEAIHALQKTIEYQPHHAGAYGQLAEIYLQQTNYADAIAAFQSRLDLQPQHAPTYHSLGMAYYQSAQYPEAIAAFEQCLALNPKHPDANHDLAITLLMTGDPEKAMNYFFRQLELNPRPETYYNIGVILQQQDRHKEAIEYLSHAAKLDPSYLPVHLNLGALHLKNNKTEDAIAAYQQALSLKPDDPEIKHILTALAQNETPEKAPGEYISHLFDQYATYYDKHLMDVLQYQVPQAIQKNLLTFADPKETAWTVLDLGCGTGLTGAVLRPFAKKLIGIDLSEKMIDIARTKGLYDALDCLDVEASLTRYHDNDLIVAGDVFTYIGDLSPIFKKAYAALNPGGLFVFSVESTDLYPYVLQPSIRYAHTKRYLMACIEASHFTLNTFDNLVLRLQQRQPIQGFLVVLSKDVAVHGK